MSASRTPHNLPDALVANREELRRRSRAERVRPLWLWIGILTGPLSFLGVRIASIALVSHGCAAATSGFQLFGLTSFALLTAAATALGAALTVGAGLISWRIWRRTSLPEDEVVKESMPRVPFWAMGGMLVSAFCLLALLVNGALALVLSTSCP